MLLRRKEESSVLRIVKNCSYAVLLASVFASLTVQAQDSSDYLRNEIMQLENQFSQAGFHSGQGADQSLSELSTLDAWVDDSELRWKVSDFDKFEDQQVSYKVSLKNGQQVDAERDILQLGNARSAIKKSMMLANRLKNRYLTLVDMIDQALHQSLLQQRLQIANEDSNHWKSQVLTDNFRADKLLKADVALDSIWAEEMGNRAVLNRYQQGGTNSINTQQLMSIEQMIVETDRILQSHQYEQHNPLLQKAMLDNGIAEKQQRRSYAQENLALKSVKLLYDNRDDTFGAELGVNIPLTSNSFEVAQKRQNAYYAGLEVDSTRTQIAEQLTQKQFALFRLQDEWLSTQRFQQKLNSRLARVSQIGDIQLVLELKNKQVSYQKRQNQLLVRALKQYVSFLHSAGLLSAKPYRNWLQVGTPRIL